MSAENLALIDACKSLVTSTSKRKSAGQERISLVAMGGRADIAATYDAARTSTEFQNYWANADRYDADSAHSRGVRETLVARSRYEIGNNGYSDGIAKTYSDDLIGNGPTLRMQTASSGFNQLVELAWFDWCKAIQLRRKLWCMAHAKHSDGEGFAIMRTNPNLKHEIKLDIQLRETEECQSPSIMPGSGHIDGIWFDEFGNPTVYDFLKYHPGSNNRLGGFLNVEQIPAEYVIHWFKLRRPGQHRAVPEMASTLNVGAASRRWREATVAAAETAADFAALLNTDMPAGESDPASPFSSMEIQKRMMTALPMGWSASQMKSEHPNATYESFHKSQVNESARPKSMPYNKAACDSSSYNYASGRLDHQTYYGSLDIEREDCNDLCLDPLFVAWFREAVLTYGWLGGNPDALSRAASYHRWDWPKHPVADIATESASNQTRVRTGELPLSQLYADAGKDFEDELPKMAADYGVTPEEMRKILLHANFNSQNQLASIISSEAQAKQVDNAAQTAKAVDAIFAQLDFIKGALNAA